MHVNVKNIDELILAMALLLLSLIFNANELVCPDYCAFLSPSEIENARLELEEEEGHPPVI